MVKPKRWKLLFSKRAQNDAKRLKKSNLKAKAEQLLNILEQDPLQNPPPVKRLVGDYAGYYSRRINIQHRLVYSVHSDSSTVRIIGMWQHYDE